MLHRLPFPAYWSSGLQHCCLNRIVTQLILCAAGLLSIWLVRHIQCNWLCRLHSLFSWWECPVRVICSCFLTTLCPSKVFLLCVCVLSVLYMSAAINNFCSFGIDECKEFSNIKRSCVFYLPRLLGLVFLLHCRSDGWNIHFQQWNVHISWWDIWLNCMLVSIAVIKLDGVTGLCTLGHPEKCKKTGP